MHMTPPPTRVVVVACVLMLAFAVGLGFSVRRPGGSIGDPAHSKLAVITRLFPPRMLRGSDLKGVGCYDIATSSFVVTSGTECAFAIAAAVKQVGITWTARPRTSLVVTRTGDPTQTYHSDDQSQRADEPGRLDVPVTGSGSTATFACAGPAPCRVTLR